MPEQLSTVLGNMKSRPVTTLLNTEKWDELKGNISVLCMHVDSRKSVACSQKCKSFVEDVILGKRFAVEKFIGRDPFHTD